MSEVKPRRAGSWLAALLGLAMILAALALLGGGAYLISLGGSPYFAIMGLALAIAGFLVMRGSASGAWLYGLSFVATIAWALWEVGPHFWPLVSRLFAPAVLLLLVLLIYPLLSRGKVRTAWKGAYGLAALTLVGIIATGVRAFMPTPIVAAEGQPTIDAVSEVSDAPKDWAVYGADAAGTRFAALDQINKNNVGTLQEAWRFRTGDIAVSPTGFGAEDQNTPLQVGDTLYLCTPTDIVIAVDADTGTEKWRFDPKAKAPGWQRCRGLAYHDFAATPGSTLTDKRLFLTTVDARLIALDATTGQPAAGFGAGGTVDLKANMGEVKPGFYTLTSAPTVAGDNIVAAGRIADNVEVGEPSGVVRAFSLATGELSWAWDIGNPETTKLPASGEYTRATPNVWAPMSYDERLGLLYLPTGNTTPDMWGGQRTELDDRYSSSIVALEAATGRVRWNYQTVRHDLWDYDVPSQPTLYDIPDGKGATVPGLVQVTKAGQIFLLNRETGQPITEVQELPVKAGVAEGERYAATQPLSTGMPQIGAEMLTEAKMWGATPFDQLICRIQFKQMRYDGMYTAPGTDLSLQWPGSLGGMNWGGVSIDKATGYAFVNDMRLGLWTRFIKRADVPGGPSAGTEMGLSSQTGTPYLSERNRFLSPLQIPCQEPPYGTMTAVDLKTHKIAWQVPLGTVEDTGPFGIKMHLPIPIGMPTIGGSMATKSGLVFFAATQDYYLRAFDGANGKELWKQRLPVGSQSTPITYVSPKSGKQFVLISAGGARQSPDRGDYVIAYTLPQ